jgi:hypothetical protein
MEVHGRQPSDPQPAIERFQRNQSLYREVTRERVRRAREGLDRIEAERRRQVHDTRPPQSDVVDLSIHDPATDEARAQMVADLRRAHVEGTLATPERIARAAERILSGEPG